MQKHWRVIPLLAGAGLYLVFGLGLLRVMGPNWIMSPVDTAYINLFNALNVARGLPIDHLVWPGIPTVMIDAVVIRVVHLFYGQGDIVADVLANPELYFNAINHVMLALIVCAIFIFGLATTWGTGSLLLGLLVQLCPFLIPEWFHALPLRGMPSNIQLICGLLLAAVTVASLRRDLSTDNRIIFYVVASAALCGLGISAKLSIAAIVLLPFLFIPGTKWKLRYCACLALSLAIFLLPGIIQGKYFFRYFFAAGSLRSHLVGQPGQSFWQGLLVDAKHQAHNHSLLLKILLYSAGFTAVISIVAFWRRSLRKSPEYRLLWCAVVSMAVVWVYLLPKWMRPHYFFGYLPLWSLPVVAAYCIVMKSLARWRICQFVFGALVLAAVCLGIHQRNKDLVEGKITPKCYTWYQGVWDDALAVDRLLHERYPEGAWIFTPPTNNLYMSLDLGNQGSKLRYTDMLSKILPPNVYIYCWDGLRCYDRSRKRFRIQDILSMHKGAAFTAAKRYESPYSPADLGYIWPKDVLFSDAVFTGEMGRLFTIKQILVGGVASASSQRPLAEAPAPPAQPAAWMTDDPLPQWYQLDTWPENVGWVVSGYVLQAANADVAGRMPGSWRFEGSDDATHWSVLHSQADIPAWQAGESRSYPLAAAGHYRYYRLFVTDGTDLPGVGLSAMKLIVEADSLYSPRWRRLFDLTFTNAEGDKAKLSDPFWETAAAPAWIQTDLGEGNAEAAAAYSLRTGPHGPDATGRMPKEWQLLGSNDGHTWDVVDTRTDEVDWQLDERRIYPISKPGRYRYYRLHIGSSNDPNIIRLYDLRMF